MKSQSTIESYIHQDDVENKVSNDTRSKQSTVGYAPTGSARRDDGFGHPERRYSQSS